MTVSHVLGCGMQKGATEYYRGVQIEPSLLPKVQVDIVVSKVPVRAGYRKGEACALHRPYRRRQDLRLRRGKRCQGAHRRRGLRRLAGRRITSIPFESQNAGFQILLPIFTHTERAAQSNGRLFSREKDIECTSRKSAAQTRKKEEKFCWSGKEICRRRSDELRSEGDPCAIESGASCAL